MVRWVAGMKHSPTNDNRQSNSVAPDYVIYKDGSTYYAEACAPGLADFSGTVHSTVANNAIGALTSGGKIAYHGQATTFPIATTLTFDGGGSGTRHFIVEGAGIDQTIFEPAVDVNAFTVQGNVVVSMSNFKINLPAATSGHGIYGYADTGASPGNYKYSCGRSRFENFHITGGAGGTHWGAYLINMWGAQFRNFRIDAQGAGGIRIDGNVNDGTTTGNAQLTSGSCWFYMYKDNGVGIYLKGLSTSALGHLQLKGHVFAIKAGGTGAGMVGLQANYVRYSDIDCGLDVENLAKGIYFVNSIYTTVRGRYLMPLNGGTAIDFNATGNYENYVSDITIDTVNGNLTAIHDAGTDTRPNRFERILISGVNTGSITRSNYTWMHQVRDRTNSKYSEASNTETVGVGVGQVVVTHNLLATPLLQRIHVTPDWDTTTYVDTIGAAQFTIHFGAVAPGGGGACGWRANINPDLE